MHIDVRNLIIHTFDDNFFFFHFCLLFWFPFSFLDSVLSPTQILIKTHVGFSLHTLCGPPTVCICTVYTLGIFLFSIRGEKKRTKCVLLCIVSPRPLWLSLLLPIPTRREREN